VRAETQREILQRFFALRDAHTTELAPEPVRQRSSVYTDPARLAAEEQALFRGRALMVGMSADAAEELAGLGPELGEYGFEDFRFFAERTGHFDANWKLIHDTFMESYTCSRCTGTRSRRTCSRSHSWATSTAPTRERR